MAPLYNDTDYCVAATRRTMLLQSPSRHLYISSLCGWDRPTRTDDDVTTTSSVTIQWRHNARNRRTGRRSSLVSDSAVALRRANRRMEGMEMRKGVRKGMLGYRERNQ